MNSDHKDLEKIEDGLSKKLIYRKTEKENTKIIIDFSKDKQDFERFCPKAQWEQPCLDDYKGEPKSYLPEGCLPEEEKKSRAESKAVEP